MGTESVAEPPSVAGPRLFPSCLTSKLQDRFILPARRFPHTSSQAASTEIRRYARRLKIVFLPEYCASLGGATDWGKR